MSFQEVVARRYAKGLMLSLGAQNIDKVELELNDFVFAYSDEKSGLRRVFGDPAFSPRERNLVINKLAIKMSMDERLSQFLLFLTYKRRFDLLPAIARFFVLMSDEHAGRLRVMLKSTSPISDAQVAIISQSLAKASGKKVVIDHEIDAKLLAGLRVEVAGTIFDGTLKAKLAALRSQLLHEIGQ